MSGESARQRAIEVYMRKTLLVACLLASLGTAAAQKQDRLIAFYGVGTSSCGTWLDAGDGEKRNKNDIRRRQFESWMDGYLSGYNMWASNAPAEGIYRTDVAGARRLLDNYCRENPTATFVSAVGTLIAEQRGAAK
jgi:hypothetical protein